MIILSPRMRSHTGSIKTAVTLAAALAALGLISSLLANPPGQRNDNQPWVLLLRNGEIIQGLITHAEDRYRVVVPGGEITVKQSEVLCCCPNIEAVYEQRVKIIRQDSVQDHLELTEWCQRVGLPEQAEDELAQAKAIDPTHPLIPLLERRLKMAAETVEQGEGTGKPVPVGPTAHELDLMVRGMPPRTVEAFAQTIQPMLMHSCATAGCHGQGAGKGFELLHIPAGTNASRRLTQRNLYAVLGYVDRNNPANSPLLTAPRRAHGTARAPIFTDRQLSQYRQLAVWCQRVAQIDDSVLQASYNEPLSGSWNDNGPVRGTQGRRPPPADDFGRPSPRAKRNSLNPSAEPDPLAPPADARDARSSRTTKRGAAANSPDDPFDPDEFNAHFAPRASSRPATDRRPGDPQADSAMPDAPLPPEERRAGSGSGSRPVNPDP